MSHENDGRHWFWLISHVCPFWQREECSEIFTGSEPTAFAHPFFGAFIDVEAPEYIPEDLLDNDIPLGL